MTSAYMPEVNTLTGFALNEEYKHFARLGDKLAEVNSLINWEAFRPIVGVMYNNKSEKGGRPNIDEIMMIKLLVLHEWHGLFRPRTRKAGGRPDILPQITWFSKGHTRLFNGLAF